MNNLVSKTALRPETATSILPHDGLAKERPVYQFAAISRSTMWAQIKAGKFPKPVKTGARSIAWRCAEVRAHVDSLGA